MSDWTVAAGADESDKVVADILQHVDDDMAPAQFPSPTKERDTPEHVPAPLTAAELATPVKDPLETFNAWVRTQTPNSARQSPIPTPGAQGFTASVAATPSSAPRPLVFTPHKNRPPMENVAMPVPLTPGQPGHGVSAMASMASSLQQQQQQQQQQLGTPMEPFDARGRSAPMGSGMSTPMHGVPNAPVLQQGGPPTPTMLDGPDQSPLFDPYATSNTASIDSIRGRVYETAKDQHGCRYLQRLLDATYEGAEAAQIIFAEIVPHVAELMTDQYANFLVQKLFDMMPNDVRYQVAQVAAPYMSSIALTPHGTFSIQKLIETITTREETEIVKHALARDVVRLVKDVHGNHVIQKVLQRFGHDDKQFIYDAMCADCLGIATNKQGCCVLQRCLEHSSPEQRTVLVGAIVTCSTQLVQDPFGNYVVQYVLDANDINVNDEIAVLLVPEFVHLCGNKFSSNVMEKMLRLISPGVRDQFVSQLKDGSILQRLLQDDFGNYVVQTALNVAPPHQAEALVALIRPLMHTIRNAPYAKKLEAKMDVVLRRRQNGHMRHSPSAGSFSMRSDSSYGGSPTPSPHHQPPSRPASGSVGVGRGGQRQQLQAGNGFSPGRGRR